MDFAEAAAFIWLVGERQGSTTRLDVALAVYLRDPAIARELAALR